LPNNGMVEVCGLVKRFGSAAVLRDISFNVQQGETCVVIGPSGSGKSTMLRCINGLEQPNAGTITIGGREVHWSQRELIRLRRDVGMVFQHYTLFPHLNVLANLTLAPRKILGMNKREANLKAMNLLERVDMSRKCDAYPSSLSGGEQQRIAIARALMMDPKVMLFDEITSALDPELVGGVLAVMMELARAGMTMIVVTHEMRFAEAAASQVMFMCDGKLVEQGAAEEVMRSPTHVRTQAFLNSVLQLDDARAVKVRSS
jgi:ABC-type polar amino acid transport system ATPase subunit